MAAGRSSILSEPAEKLTHCRMCGQPLPDHDAVDRADMQLQNEALNRRLEKMTADERGEWNEENLVSLLHEAFPEDQVRRLGRGRAGGDILHTVRA